MATSTLGETVLTFSVDLPFRRLLKMSVSALLTEAGFTAAEDDTLETLTEVAQSFLTELGRSSKALTELSGRTEPLVGDVIVALVEIGQNVSAIPAYARRPHKTVLSTPLPSGPAPESRRLQVGVKRPRPAYVPDNLPDFPDPHTYIKTLTYKPPVSEYQIIREKASAQKRDIERALTRFIAKTGDTENLFPDDPYAFPLIANKPKPLPYIDALLPKDHEMDSEEQEMDENWLKQQQQQQQQNRTSTDKTQDKASTDVPVTPTQQQTKSTDAPTAAAAGSLDDNQIDNPYLRPIVMPKLKTSYKKTR